MTDVHNDSLSIDNNYTIYENNADTIIPTLLITTPCGFSFLGFMTLMVYTKIKPLLNNK